jgi:hypothetical protein
VEAETMSDWNNLANGVIQTRFGPPNEITVLFEDRTRTFPMAAAATLADLAQRLAEEGGPQRRQMLSVTVKLTGAPGFSAPLLAANEPMNGCGIRPHLAAYRIAKRRGAQRVLVLVVGVLLPWLAVALMVPYLL